jgi:hypothetical protein
MTRKHRLAFNALKKLNVPVYERCDIKNFQISAEHNFDTKFGDTLWADYYDGQMMMGNDWEFGVNPIITKTLAKYGLYAEWINAGELGVYD